ncbi:FUSC family protein [Ferrimonas balearica]|uniref:FUSC family protein n=1 Tax=Ferrimonas balearica TaxID=44012 RepID=UPI001C9975D5|nr:FUSC family protein [Ferrimonas balearica]MBY5992878.1 FUSC family protein [Ferrimonas balearica]
MFSLATREALKLALAVTIAMLLALSFGWAKPYWAAVAVIVLATAESHSQALYKGWNRLVGTTLGIVLAVVLVANFAQQPMLFMTALVLLGGLCVYLAGCPNYGYAFQITLVVTTIIAAMGQMDSANTFVTGILRIEENVLGIAVFTLVYALLWPQTPADRFFAQLGPGLSELQAQLDGDGPLEPAALARVRARLDPLPEQLQLPLGSSYLLRFRPLHWQRMVQALLAYLDALEAQLASGSTPDPTERAQQRAVVGTLLGLAEARGRGTLPLDEANAAQAPSSAPLAALASVQREAAMALGQLPSDAPRTRLPWPKLHLRRNGAVRLHQASSFMLILVVALILWVQLPVPGGVLFPIMAVSLSSPLVTFPPRMIGVAFVAITALAVPVLIQYALLLPHLTEAWQLGAFYFINLFVIWRLFAGEGAMKFIMRMLGAQLLVVMTTGAVNLVPSFAITQSLTMLVLVYLVLMVVHFGMRLLPPPKPACVP